MKQSWQLAPFFFFFLNEVHLEISWVIFCHRPSRLFFCPRFFSSSFTLVAHQRSLSFFLFQRLSRDVIYLFYHTQSLMTEDERGELEATFKAPHFSIIIVKKRGSQTCIYCCFVLLCIMRHVQWSMHLIPAYLWVLGFESCLAPEAKPHSSSFLFVPVVFFFFCVCVCVISLKDIIPLVSLHLSLSVISFNSALRLLLLDLQDPADRRALTCPHLHSGCIFQRGENRLWERPKVSKDTTI